MEKRYLTPSRTAPFSEVHPGFPEETPPHLKNPLLRGKEKTIKIFIGHNNYRFLIQVLSMLRSEGYNVYATTDGIEILEWFAEALLKGHAFSLPDLIIADINLKGRRGIDLLADLRAVNWLTPMILTAKATERELAISAQKFENVIIFELPVQLSAIQSGVEILISKRAVSSRPRDAYSQTSPVSRFPFSTPKLSM